MVPQAGSVEPQPIMPQPIMPKRVLSFMSLPRNDLDACSDPRSTFQNLERDDLEVPHVVTP